MANPRKFSEKIALQHQKQAEETAAFEQIMKEVMGATRRNPQVKSQHLHISQNMGNVRAGSLPNVDRIGTDVSQSSIDLKTALNNLEEIKKGYEPPRDRRHASPSATQHRSPHHHNVHHSGHHRQTHVDQKRVDSSPYSPYLSPPPLDTHWRRTNSDSALHQSAMMSEQQSDDFINGSSFRRSPESWDPGKKHSDHMINQHLLTASLPNDSRPRSCEIPGITIYPSPQDNNSVHHHIPISSNTGSLPDLTNLHLPAQLLPPIDADDQNAMASSNNGNRQSIGSSFPSCGGSSPYNCGDPPSPYLPQSPYSPGSPHDHNAFSPPPAGHPNNSLRTNNGVCYTGDNNHVVVGTSGDGSINRAASPSSRGHQNDVAAQMIETYKQNHNYGSPSPHRNQQVCYFPRNSGTRTNPSVEGLTVDTSALSLEHRQSPFEPQQQPHMFALPPNNHYQNVPQGQTYVSPQSPLQQHVGMARHRSATPSDHSCSAPTSPVSHSLSPVNSPELPLNNPPPSKSPFSENSYYNVQQTNVLQHQLEQFKMVQGSDIHLDGSDHYLMMSDNRNGTTCANGSGGGPSSPAGLYMNSGSTLQQSPGAGLRGNVNVDYSPQQSPQAHVTDNVETQHSSAVYYPTSQGAANPLIQTTTSFIYSKSEISPSSPTYPMSSATMASVNNQSPTPHTPTSIPDIILTGPNIEDPLKNQDFAKDLGSAMASMSGSFDANDLFSSSVLDPIDFDGLQILQDITDSNTDDTFRLERS